MDRQILSAMSDEDLVRLYFAAISSERESESRQILGVLFGRYEDKVSRYYQKRFFGDDAEDVQIMFWIKVMESLSGFEPRGNGSFRAWLFTVCRTTRVDYIRREKRRADSCSLDDELPLKNGSSVRRLDCFPQDYDLEEEVELRENLQLLLGLVDEFFDKSHLKKLAFYLLGQRRDLPEEYIGYSSKQISDKKSYVRRRLREKFERYIQREKDTL
jgi:RNA polymerase sigma factor (sigma-70 family)